MARHPTMRMWKQILRADAYTILVLGLFIFPDGQYALGRGDKRN